MKKKNEVAKIPATIEELEKLTESEIAAIPNDKYESIFKIYQDAITKAEAEGCNSRANRLRDKVDLFVAFVGVEGGATDVRRQDWDLHHQRIVSCIRNYLLEDNYGHLPSCTTIAQKTKLSRQTVSNHLKEGISNKFYQEGFKHLEYLTNDVLGKLYKMAIQGNVSAARVFLDSTLKAAQTPPANIKQQNNYLQINNTRIDEVTVNELPEAARIEIESIIMQYSKKTA
jgi:DNA-binding transcriptional ArsR family regulator